MNFEEYSLKFSLSSKHAPSLVSNPRYDMSRFLTGVSNLVKEECCTTMLYDNTTLSRIIVYAQSIEESKLEMRGRDVKNR